MKDWTELKVGKWYWLTDPGSNCHRGFEGPGKCLTNVPNNEFCGGASVLFEFYDSDTEENTIGAFGLLDIGREVSDPKCIFAPGSIEERILALERRVEELEAWKKTL